MEFEDFILGRHYRLIRRSFATRVARVGRARPRG
jgi:hypothetical protein